MLHTNNPIIKHKAGLLNLAESLQNVSKACKIMGVSRDTFYRYQELVETDGLEGLINRERRVPNLKNRVDEGTEQAVIGHAIDFPAHGQHRTSNELRKRGIFVSGSGVRSIWLRHKLENFKGRLSALEAKVANEGIVLSDEQIAALERKHEDDVACGEIETAHPGYLVCARHVLRRQSQRCGAHLPANVYRHLQQSRALQAVHHKNADHRR